MLGLHYLHKYCGIIHTDLKPENVMICLDQEELKNIYDKGQIKKNNEKEKNLEKFRMKVQKLNSKKSQSFPKKNEFVDSTQNIEKQQEVSRPYDS